MKLTVIGTGYVGLVSGVCLAAKGHDVTCVDLRLEVVEQLNRGRPHIHEADLPELLGRVIATGKFRARLAEPMAMESSEIILIAVGTPSLNGRIDLGQIREAARQIGTFLRHSSLSPSIVVKSTALPGTTDTVVRSILEAESGRKLGDFGLGMNPEFLREGEAIADFLEPDRIVLGHEDAKTLARLEELYSAWECEKIRTNTRTAEMIKYANNCLLATQISAVNELANVAVALGGVDMHGVLQGVHLDRRWNPTLPGGGRVWPGILAYLKPGCGFGGSCFPKDVQALRSCALDAGITPHVMDAVLAVNSAQPRRVAGLLERQCGPLAGKTVLLLGLAFKPGTDDVRESASLQIVRDLVQHGAIVRVHDPAAMSNAAKELGGLPVEYLSHWEAALEPEVPVVLATAWPEYQRLTEPSLSRKMEGGVLFDARGFLDASALPASVRYLTIGFRPRNPSPEGGGVS